jgi:hypothetical protein
MKFGTRALVLFASLSFGLIAFQNCGPGFQSLNLDVNAQMSSSAPSEKLGVQITSADVVQGDATNVKVTLAKPSSHDVRITLSALSPTGTVSADGIFGVSELVIPAGSVEARTTFRSTMTTYNLAVKPVNLKASATDGSVIEPVQIEVKIQPKYKLASYASFSNWGCGILTSGEVNCTEGQQALFDATELVGAKSIKIGLDTVCLINANSLVRCVLIDQHANTRFTPGNLGAVKSISVSQFGQMCAQDSNDEIWCWSRNSNNVAGRVADFGKAKSYSAGDSDACALSQDGIVRCVEFLNDGTYGPAKLISGLVSPLQVSAGFSEACALESQGTVKCWALYDYTYTGAVVPDVPVAISNLTSAVAINAEETTACAALANGQVKCWGKIDYPVGAAPTGHDAVLIEGIAGVRQVFNRQDQSCALDSDSHVMCWTPSRDPLAPGRVTAGQSNQSDFLDFTAADRAIDVGGIYYGNGCAVLVSGHVKCYGYYPFSGVLGNGSSAQVDFETPTEVSNVTDAVSIKTSFYGACVLTKLGEVTCWGDNSAGKRGDGTTVASPLPNRVAGLSNVKNIAATDFGYCAVTNDGRVACWGSRPDLPLQASGEPSTSLKPEFLPGLSGLKSIEGFSNGYCVITSNDGVTCWESMNPKYYAMANSATPFAITGVSNVIALSGGGQHMCALMKSGRVSCWGVGVYAETVSDISTLSTRGTAAQPVQGIESAVSLTASIFTTCAKLSDASIKCWGKDPLASGDLRYSVATTVNFGVGVGKVDIAAGFPIMAVTDEGIARAYRPPRDIFYLLLPH